METELIIQILERMAKDQQEFFARMEALLSDLPRNNEQWIDGLEVQSLLSITRKTVYRLSQNGTLEPRRIGRRNYYSRSEIFKLRDQFLK